MPMIPIWAYLLMSGASAGAKVYGAAQQANAAGQQNALNAAEFEENRGDTQAKSVADFLTGIYNSNIQQQEQQATQGLALTQMSPYTPADYLNKENIKRSFAQGYTPGQGFTGTFDVSALSPDNLAASKSQFDKYAAAAQPNVPISGDPSAEAFRTDYLNRTNSQQQQLMDQVMAYLRHIGLYNGQDLGNLASTKIPYPFVPTTTKQGGAAPQYPVFPNAPQR